jgi:hypothetical protein
MVPCPPLSSFQGEDSIAIRLAVNRVQNLLNVTFIGASKRDLYDNESCLTEPA